MILIADSGSTKTHWSLINYNKCIGSCKTSGINPFFASSDEIFNILNTELNYPNEKITQVHFYGAGCTKEKSIEVKSALEELFTEADIKVESDLLAVARSLCQKQSGIACILGTGSNSCLYNGQEIAEQVSPLGFILGDEGSGAFLGKIFMGDLLKNQFPKQLSDLFFSTYNFSASEILERVYYKSFPNRFLASFTKFIAEQINNYPILDELVANGFELFIKRNITQYTDYESLPIHFSGSIAYVFKDQLIDALKSFNLESGTICQSPMEGLIEYHLL